MRDKYKIIRRKIMKEKDLGISTVRPDKENISDLHTFIRGKKCMYITFLNTLFALVLVLL